MVNIVHRTFCDIILREGGGRILITMVIVLPECGVKKSMSFVENDPYKLTVVTGYVTIAVIFEIDGTTDIAKLIPHKCFSINATQHTLRYIACMIEGMNTRLIVRNAGGNTCPPM